MNYDLSDSDTFSILQIYGIFMTVSLQYNVHTFTFFFLNVASPSCWIPHLPPSATLTYPPPCSIPHPLPVPYPLTPCRIPHLAPCGILAHSLCHILKLLPLPYPPLTQKPNPSPCPPVIPPSDRKSTRLNSSHSAKSRMPSSA